MPVGHHSHRQLWHFVPFLLLLLLLWHTDLLLAQQQNANDVFRGKTKAPVLPSSAPLDDATAAASSKKAHHSAATDQSSSAPITAAAAAATAAGTDQQQKQLRQETLILPPPPPLHPPMFSMMPSSTTTSAPPPRNYSASYLVIAPKIVRPGLPYAVSVNILRSAEPDHIVRVEIRDGKNETVAARVVSNFRTGMPQTVVVENLSEESFLPEEDYSIYVKGETITSKTIFEDSASVQCSPKSVSIFVQTDKAIYKPGTTVHYRILVVTPELLPYTEPVDVYVDDPKQNRIVNMPKLQLRKGVHTGELQLATEPPLGNWHIHVQTGGEVKFAKEFTVDRYVLPKFEVNIKTPSFITISDELTVQLSAKYTYGKGVAGKAKVRVDLPFPRWSSQQLALDGVSGANKYQDEVGIERSVKLNSMGEATLTFDNAELRTRKIITDWGGSTIQIIAEVQEELTEVQRNATVEITAYSRDVKLEVEKQSDTFKPGLPYSVVVALKQMDDTPAKSSLPRRVQLTTFYRGVQQQQQQQQQQQEDKEVKVLELDAHGTAMLQLLPPLNSTSARVEASYDRSGQNNFTNSPIYTSLYVEAARSPSQAFVQVNADNQGVVDAGKTLSFSVKCTEPLSSFTYQVVARGVVALSEQVSLSGAGGDTQRTSASLTFTATAQMAPKSRLVVYAIRAANKEILVDAIDFKVDGLFRNNVTLSMDRNSAEPGDSVRFRVRAAPDSFVGLLAVDQSVLLLKSGNDISKELVEQDVEEYDTTSDSGAGRDWFGMRRRMVGGGRKRRSSWYPWWGVGGKDASTVFENAGLVVLTDAYLYKEPEPMMLQDEFGGMEAAAADIGIVQNEQPADGGDEAGTFDGAEAASPPHAQTTAPRLRQHFPETWVWTGDTFNTTTSDNGEVVYDAKAPDTITSWVASAFAISDKAGLGLAPTALKLKVFRPFFVRIELPYAVKRGEKMALQVLVFNYLENEQEVTVTLKHQPGFDFLQKDGTSIKKGKADKSYNVRFVSVPGGGVSRAVYFPIVFTDVGQLRLHVVAQTDQANDALEQMLRVEPEGYRVDRNVPLIVDLSNNNNNNGNGNVVNGGGIGSTATAQQSQQQQQQAQATSTTHAAASESNGSANQQASNGSGGMATMSPYRKVVDLQFPADHVPGSRKARVDVIGDIMGPVLSNVEGLVRMPYGCGEQNMVNFVPNIVVMRYLRATQRANPSLEHKAKKYMESGYQRELTYRRSDNSFSAFGDSDQHGSTWLTAFVLRSFKQAQAYIYVDDRVLEDSIAFLISQQLDSGAFVERGEVHHKLMQGGASEGGFTLTAYVLIALLENHVQNRVTETARSYLEQHLNEFKEDSYALALCTYVLHLANSPKKGDVLKMLEGLQISGTTDGTVHWTTKAPNGGKDGVGGTLKSGTARDTNAYFFQPHPADVEMSAYALLTYMLLDDKEHALPIVRWLTAQRNSLGGFSSTQDTVMALQSLGAYAEKAYSPSFNLSIKVQNGQDTHSFTVNAQNALVLQSYELPNLDAPVELEAVGTSMAFVQVQYSYHRQTLRDDVPFYCAKEVREVRNGNRLQLELCCNYTRAGARSNMAVAEVEALSGYRFDEEDVRRLTGIADLQRVELDKEDSKMNIYFNALGDVPVCLQMNTDLVYQIADQRDAQLLLYDYYDPQQQMKSTYSARQTRSLEESCPDCWPDPNAAHAASRAQAAARPSSVSSSGGGSSTAGAGPSSAAVFLLCFSVLVGFRLFSLSAVHNNNNNNNRN